LDRQLLHLPGGLKLRNCTICPHKHIYAFCMDLRKNKACFHKWHYLIGYKPIRCLFTARYELNIYIVHVSLSL